MSNIKTKTMKIGLDKTDRNNIFENLKASFNGLEVKGVDKEVNIFSKKENAGVFIGSDTGKWYYWHNTEYVVGGNFISENTGCINLGDVTGSTDSEILKNIFNLIQAYKTNGVNYVFTCLGKSSLGISAGTFLCTYNRILNEAYIRKYHKSKITDYHLTGTNSSVEIISTENVKAITELTFDLVDPTNYDLQKEIMYHIITNELVGTFYYGAYIVVGIASGTVDNPTYAVMIHSVGSEIKSYTTSKNGVASPYAPDELSSPSDINYIINLGNTNNTAVNNSINIITNSNDMDAVLLDSNMNKVYLYIGETNNKYTKGQCYIVEGVE